MMKVKKETFCLLRVDQVTAGWVELRTEKWTTVFNQSPLDIPRWSCPCDVAYSTLNDFLSVFRLDLVCLSPAVFHVM